MEEQRGGIPKQTILRNSLKGFILTNVFFLGIIWSYFPELKIKYFLIVFGSILFLFLGFFFLNSHFHKKHSGFSKEMNKPEVKQGFDIYNIVLGGFLIIIALGLYFIRIFGVGGIKIMSILILLGIFTILWGVNDLIKVRRKMKSNTYV
jgi:hypothetical protein